MNLSVLYRGPLSSCNYTCDYCPFGKTKNTRKELKDDEEKLKKFVSWVESNKSKNFGILFTPWGEALIRKHYQEAITQLSHFQNIRKVAIQTNISCEINWLKDCNLDKVALWTTYHPTQTTRLKFIKKCKELDVIGVKYCVGVVGFKDSLEEIKMLRRELNPEVYLWVNANKKIQNYYTDEEIAFITSIDPYFNLNLYPHKSLGEGCKTGKSVFSVNGTGDMFRCHFIKEKIGNIYEKNWVDSLLPRACTNSQCGCYIGYSHLEKLNLEEEFGNGILERIPLKF